VDIEYSPLVGGFAVVLNDGRAAFLTAVSLRFDPNVSFIAFHMICIVHDHSNIAIFTYSYLSYSVEDLFVMYAVYFLELK
jgi:hypothetical protein